MLHQFNLKQFKAKQINMLPRVKQQGVYVNNMCCCILVGGGAYFGAITNTNVVHAMLTGGTHQKGKSL